jgi:hypothetical protein
MTAQIDNEQQYLPKEPIDLPKPYLELPEGPDVSAAVHKATHHKKKEPIYNEHDVRTLLAWHAPGRPFRKKSKEFFVNSVLILIALEIILFLFSQYLLMLVAASIVFLSFVLSSVAPHDFYYKLSSEGLMVEDHFFLWQELYDFYFKHQEGEHLLVVRTKAYLPGELLLVLGSMSREHVKTILLPYLPYREYVKPSFMERSGDWLSQTFPLENLPKKKS